MADRSALQDLRDREVGGHRGDGVVEQALVFVLELLTEAVDRDRRAVSAEGPHRGLGSNGDDGKARAVRLGQVDGVAQGTLSVR